MTASREIHLVRRPNGMPVPADFAVVDVNVPPTGEGQVKVQTLIMSVDPYMRPRYVDRAGRPSAGRRHRAGG